MIIASLTTIPERRSDFIYSCIDSFINQTIKFDLIKVYFQGTKDQCWFKDIENNKTVQIEYVSNYCKSKSKYYYSLLKYPDDDIVLLDDDLTLDEHFLEKLLIGKKKEPNCIITHTFAFPYLDVKINNCLSFPLNREKQYLEYKNLYIKTLSGWGTLIPAHIFDNTQLLDIQKSLDVFPSSDEFWLYCISIINNIKTYCPGLYNSMDEIHPDKYYYPGKLYSINKNKVIENGKRAYYFLKENGIDINNLEYKDLDNEA